MDLDTSRRFDDRVDDYVRYRPEYPAAMFDWLRDEQGITADWDVADIGAGTGISSRQFLARGHRVIAVEPNAGMRAAARRDLGIREKFTVIDGAAEATGLSDASIDLVSAAQAFHWFDAAAVRQEWSRILRPRGRVAIYWNTRRHAGSAFLDGYEALQSEYCIDYAKIRARHPDDGQMLAWFGAGLSGHARFPTIQKLDFENLRGRLLSSSSAPLPDHPGHVPMLAALNALFEANKEDGKVEIIYDTRIFLGSIVEP